MILRYIYFYNGNSKGWFPLPRLNICLHLWVIGWLSIELDICVSGLNILVFFLIYFTMIALSFLSRFHNFGYVDVIAKVFCVPSEIVTALLLFLTFFLFFDLSFLLEDL